MKKDNTPTPDMLYVFTGISGQQIVEVLAGALGKRRELQRDATQHLADHRQESLLGFVLSASAAFYLAEQGTNPNINTPIDALQYISTCLNVGYADTQAETQTGKLISALAMIFGPALSDRGLDPPREVDPAPTQNLAIVERLDAILEELRSRPL